MTCKRDNHPLLIAKRVCPPNCFVADERLRNLTRKPFGHMAQNLRPPQTLGVGLDSGLKANELYVHVIPI